jgi:methionyl aminopeptidase
MDLEKHAQMRLARARGIPTFRLQTNRAGHFFPAALCTSVNEVVVHGIPSRRAALKEGDIVSIDFGATLEGYVGDAAITVPVGKVSAEKERLLAATQEALRIGIAACRAGNRVGDVSHAVQSYVESRGYNVVRAYCGHGVGTDLHEEPQVPNFGEPRKGPRLGVGWVLAIEPMVNAGTEEVEELDDGWTVVTKDRRPSAHFEHSVVITPDGADILTLPNAG